MEFKTTAARGIMFPVLVLVGLAGCRVGFEPPLTDPQPGRYGHGEWVLGTPEPLNWLASGSIEQDLELSADGAILWFASDMGGGLGGPDLYRVEMADALTPRGAPVHLGGLSTEAHEVGISFSADGLGAVMITNWTGGAGETDLWRGRRSSNAVAWQASDFVCDLATSSGGSEYDVELSSGGLRVLFSSTGHPQGPGGQDIYTAGRASMDEPFGPPSLLEGINTQAAEADPAQTADGRVVVFASDRAGGRGGLDLWWARRDDPGVPFGDPRPLEALNTEHYEGEPRFTADGSGLYFRREYTFHFVAVLQGP